MLQAVVTHLHLRDTKDQLDRLDVHTHEVKVGWLVSDAAVHAAAAHEQVDDGIRPHERREAD